MGAPGAPGLLSSLRLELDVRTAQEQWHTLTFCVTRRIKTDGIPG